MLTDRIIEVFSEYDLSEIEMKENVRFLSDRGPNIKWGLIRGGFKRLTCYAHIIHNLVTSMLTEKRVKVIVEQCATLSSYVKNNGFNRDLNPTLKRYTTTRWNSVHIMIDCIIKSYQDVYKLLLAKQRHRNEARMMSSKQPDSEITEHLTVLNVAQLTEIRDFLLPFKV